MLVFMHACVQNNSAAAAVAGAAAVAASGSHNGCRLRAAVASTGLVLVPTPLRAPLPLPPPQQAEHPVQVPWHARCSNAAMCSCGTGHSLQGGNTNEQQEQDNFWKKKGTGRDGGRQAACPHAQARISQADRQMENHADITSATSRFAVDMLWYGPAAAPTHGATLFSGQ